MKPGDLVTLYLVPTMGSIIGILMFLAPMPDVLRVRKDGRMGELNPVPYPAILANCIGWVVYSYMVRDWFIFVPNEVGMLIGLFYILSTYGACTTSMQNKIDFLVLVTFTVLPLLGAVLAIAPIGLDLKGRAQVWGVMVNIVRRPGEGDPGGPAGRTLTPVPRRYSCCTTRRPCPPCTK